MSSRTTGRRVVILGYHGHGGRPSGEGQSHLGSRRFYRLGGLTLRTGSAQAGDAHIVYAGERRTHCGHCGGKELAVEVDRTSPSGLLRSLRNSVCA